MSRLIVACFADVPLARIAAAAFFAALAWQWTNPTRRAATVKGGYWNMLVNAEAQQGRKHGVYRITVPIRREGDVSPAHEHG